MSRPSAVLEGVLREIDSLPPEEYSALAQHLARAVSRAGRPALRKLELLLTEDCTLRCHYCWVHKKPGHMPWSTAAKAIDLVFAESGSVGPVEITLFGGEPLMAWPVLTKCVSHAESQARACSKQLSWAITTNGTLLDEAKMEYGALHGIPYLLSIDGDRPTHDRYRKTADGRGSFDTIAPRIPLLKRYQPWVGVRMTVLPDTAAHLSQNVVALLERGINQFIIGVDVGGRWTREALGALAREWIAVAERYVTLRQQRWPVRISAFESPYGSLDGQERTIAAWGCEGGVDKFAVSPSGDIYPCSRYADADWLRGASWLGHVSTGLVAEATRRGLTDSRLLVRGKCMHCRLHTRCSGGCPATNWLATGSPYMPDPVTCSLARMSRRLRNPDSPPRCGLSPDLCGETGGWLAK